MNFIFLEFLYETNVWEMTSLPHPKAVARTKSPGHTLALGSKEWIIENDNCGDVGVVEKRIKITSCEEGLFTCFVGTCIDITKRCDTVNDCGDWSDEKDCNLVIFPESYFKEFPPLVSTGFDQKRLQVKVTSAINDILEINEIDAKFSCKFTLSLEWKDDRVEYQNLQEKYDKNKLNEESKRKLWVPTPIFTNTDVNKEALVDIRSKLFIKNEGNYTYAKEEVTDETRVYKGSENPILYTRSYSISFLCDYDLMLYPFDTQTCKIVLDLPVFEQSLVKMVSKGINMKGKTQLLKYDVKKWLMEDTKSGSVIKIIFGRKILSQVLTTYLPTILLVLIIHSTNYYRDFFFEAVVTVNLTGDGNYQISYSSINFQIGMLVLTTMFVSVAGSLPQTSNVKMIEVWLLSCLMVPFTEVLLQVLISISAKKLGVILWK